MNYDIGLIKKSRGKGVDKSDEPCVANEERMLARRFYYDYSAHCVTEEMLGDKKRDDYISVVVPLPKL